MLTATNHTQVRSTPKTLTPFNNVAEATPVMLERTEQNKPPQAPRNVPCKLSNDSTTAGISSQHAEPYRQRCIRKAASLLDVHQHCSKNGEGVDKLGVMQQRPHQSQSVRSVVSIFTHPRQVASSDSGRCLLFRCCSHRAVYDTWTAGVWSPLQQTMMELSIVKAHNRLEQRRRNERPQIVKTPVL